VGEVKRVDKVTPLFPSEIPTTNAIKISNNKTTPAIILFDVLLAMMITLIDNDLGW
jgi:hypothetical protein